MGDRANIAITGHHWGPVFLYTHNHGADAAIAVQNALLKTEGLILDDHYMARVLFDHLVRPSHRDEIEGFGISTHEVPGNRPTLWLDHEHRVVRVLQGDHGPLPEREVLARFTYEEFLAMEVGGLGWAPDWRGSPGSQPDPCAESTNPAQLVPRFSRLAWMNRGGLLAYVTLWDGDRGPLLATTAFKASPDGAWTPWTWSRHRPDGPPMESAFEIARKVLPPAEFSEVPVDSGMKHPPPYCVTDDQGNPWSSHLASIRGPDGALEHYREAKKREMANPRILDGNKEDITDHVLEGEPQ